MLSHTLGIILLNVWVFLKELVYGDRFVWEWSLIPARIIHGQGLITILTSMFMHAGWMHIIGNMIYLWAFGREIENAMGSFRFTFFYLAGGIVAMTTQVLGDPHANVPCLGASGAIAAVMGAFIVTYPRDRIRTVVFLFIFFRVTFIPACAAHRILVLDPGLQLRRSRACAHWRRGLSRPHRRIPFRRRDGELFVNPYKSAYGRFS